MWVKKSKEEPQKSMSQKSRMRASLSVAALCFILITTFRGIIGYGATGQLFHYFYEIADRTPVALLISSAIGLTIYWLSGKKSAAPKGETLMCPKCEATKFDDGDYECPCGGHFEDLNTMKWVEDKSS